MVKVAGNDEVDKLALQSDQLGKQLAIVYIFISFPLLIVLCFVTGPFQVPDEPNHFLRAVQISHGGFEPVVAASDAAAGGFVDAQALSLAKTLGDISIDFDPSHRFNLNDVLRNNAETTNRHIIFASFSNTVIYLPAAHLLPAITIGLVRKLGGGPLIWLYCGRVTNAVAAMLVSALAISLLETGALFAFTICMTPMVLFEEASLSADALVISFSVLLGSLVVRIAKRETLNLRFYAALFLSMLFVCVAKFAYLPIALLPPLVATFQTRKSRDILRLTITSGAIGAIWVAWSLSVQGKVFTVGDHDGIVSVNEQLMYLKSNPFEFIKIWLRTIQRDPLGILEQMVGRRLGWLDVMLPKTTVRLALAALVVAFLFRAPVAGLQPLSRLTTFFLLSGALIASYLLLYLQFTPVGNDVVDGFQGRYLIPLLPLMILIFPVLSLSEEWRKRLCKVIIAVCTINGFVMVFTLWWNYWH